MWIDNFRNTNQLVVTQIIFQFIRCANIANGQNKNIITVNGKKPNCNNLVETKNPNIIRQPIELMFSNM